MRTTPVKPGTKWGMLLVIRPLERNESSQVLWEVKCDCGKIATAWGYSLVKNTKYSCGCVRRWKGQPIKREPVHLAPEPPEKKEILDLGTYISEELGGDADKVVRAFIVSLKELGEVELAITVKRKWKLLHKAAATS